MSTNYTQTINRNIKTNYLFCTQYNHYQHLCTFHISEEDAKLFVLTVIIPINGCYHPQNQTHIHKEAPSPKHTSSKHT